jgi:hypothetical protein
VIRVVCKDGWTFERRKVHVDGRCRRSGPIALRISQSVAPAKQRASPSTSPPSDSHNTVKMVSCHVILCAVSCGAIIATEFDPNEAVSPNRHLSSRNAHAVVNESRIVDTPHRHSLSPRHRRTNNPFPSFMDSKRTG